jgi:hypothetical protein
VRKFVIVTLVLVFTLTLAYVPAYSAVKIGDTCKSVGQTTSIKGSTLICVKSGSQIVWSKGIQVDAFTAFAQSHYKEAQKRVDRLLADAKKKAKQLSSRPHCSAYDEGFLSAFIFGDSALNPRTIGDDLNPMTLVYENSEICDVVVRASAGFACEGGRTYGESIVIGTGQFTLKAGQRLLITENRSSADNIYFYFPNVINDCRWRFGFANEAEISSFDYYPSIVALKKTLPRGYNQVLASKKASTYLTNAKIRANKILKDAKNPELIAKMWEKVLVIQAAAEVTAKANPSDKMCVVGIICELGSIGPGGGIVFYDAGSRKSWGRYLEYAPEGWSGTVVDPEVHWCQPLTASPLTMQQRLPTQFAFGKKNTHTMLAGCSSGAAVIAHKYNGGAKNDWFLPSNDELIELGKYLIGQTLEYESFGGLKITQRGGFSTSLYWTSSEFNGINGYNGVRYFPEVFNLRFAPLRRYLYGNYSQFTSDSNHFTEGYVRPIRAF